MDDSTGRGFLHTFMKRAEELGLDLADCRGQCYDNGANVKDKEAGVQARLLEINSKSSVCAMCQSLIEFSSCGLRQIFN